MKHTLLLLLVTLSVLAAYPIYRHLAVDTHPTGANEEPVFPEAELDFSEETTDWSGLRIAIEKLTPPEKTLERTATERILQRILDRREHRYEEQKDIRKEPYNILRTSEMPKEMVSFPHPFFDAMYQAYADHRPFVLSPDMVWLLIEQGFAHHVEHNYEALRDKFVDFDGKTSIVLIDNDVPIDAPREIWERQIGRFVDSVGRHTHGNLPELLTADFTTTTCTERVASQITMMSSMRNYFEFVEIYCICGIPEVTLLGTPEDWQKILDRTHELGKYDLEWWTDELEPVLKKIVAAAKGTRDAAFWRSMFRYHDQGGGGCIPVGPPSFADGWVVKFYPYDEGGNRCSLRKIYSDDFSDLPAETVAADVKHITYDDADGSAEIRMLELVAGFVGVDQNDTTFALKPRIGWFLRMKSPNEDKIDLPKHTDNIDIRVNKIPRDFEQLEYVKTLNITFIHKIDIPDWMGKMRIDELYLSGEIDEAGIRRIRKMFPETVLRINGRIVNPEDSVPTE